MNLNHFPEAAWGKALEVRSIGPFLYGRFLSHSDRLKDGQSKTGVLRTEAAWKNPALITQTLYILHSALGDDQEPFSFGIEEILKTVSSDHIQLVFPGIAQSFLVNEATSLNKPDFGGWLKHEVIPAFEHGTRSTQHSRGLIGVSMGGFAALSYFLRNPDLFEFCGAIMPGLIVADPVLEASIAGYCARHQISPEAASGLKALYRAEFPNSIQFKNHNPIELIKSLEASLVSEKKIRIEVGSLDDLGLHEGVKEFERICLNRKIPIRARIIENGGHTADFVSSRLPSFVLDYINRK